MVTAVSTQQQEGAILIVASSALLQLIMQLWVITSIREGITFNQDGMREHLMECLERKELSLFPTIYAQPQNALKSTCLWTCTVFATYQSCMDSM